MFFRQLLRALLYSGIFFVIIVATAFVTMEFLTKGKTVSVPDLMNKQIVEAGGILKDLRLKFSIEGEEFHPAIRKDHIISQNPVAGAVIKEGRSISVIVSKGAQEVTVPRLEMEHLRKAEKTIRENGLDIGSIARANSSAGKDIVIAQYPQPGSVTDRGEKVELLISSGSQDVWFKTPFLSGKMIEEASAILERMGIEITIVLAKGEEPGRIIGQKPKTGFPIRKGDGIELTVTEK